MRYQQVVNLLQPADASHSKSYVPPAFHTHFTQPVSSQANKKPRNPLSEGKGEAKVRSILTSKMKLRILSGYVITESGQSYSVGFLILPWNIPIEVQSDYHDPDLDEAKRLWLEKYGFMPLVTVHEGVVQTEKGAREFERAVLLAIEQQKGGVILATD